MRLLISFLLPWLTFFKIGRPIAGIIGLVLQISCILPWLIFFTIGGPITWIILISWILAYNWATYALGQYKTDQKIDKKLTPRSKG